MYPPSVVDSVLVVCVTSSGIYTLILQFNLMEMLIKLTTFFSDFECTKQH